MDRITKALPGRWMAPMATKKEADTKVNLFFAMRANFGAGYDGYGCDGLGLPD